MKIELKYFTGTGNSWKVLNTCSEQFKTDGHETAISAIRPGEQSLPTADLLGFCFPVYAFGIPRICRRYLNDLDAFSTTQKVFILITAGAASESGYSVGECVRILKRKNCEIVYTAVIEMPANWIVAMNPPAKEEASEIIRKGVEQSRKIASEILDGIRKYHAFNVPIQYGRIRFYQDYFLFKYLGIYNIWRMFRVYETCNGCGLCAKICPTHSIVMDQEKPKWLSTCEQCMRCANYCHREAIYQSGRNGGTLGRNRYLETGLLKFEKINPPSES